MMSLDFYVYNVSKYRWLLIFMVAMTKVKLTSTPIMVKY